MINCFKNKNTGTYISFTLSEPILNIFRNQNKIHSNFKFHFNKNPFFNFSQKIKLDPFLILEIPRNADWKTIKIAYFKLARLYHPDLNKNDERAHKKFLQIKDAYEHFERKYNPEKYANIRQPINSKFDEESSNEGAQSTSDSGDANFESIREKNKKKSDSNKGDTNFEFKHHDKNMNTNFEASGDYFRDEQLRLDVEKQRYISKFLFTKIPVPRSPKMVDRLNLKSITLGKGKLFGPEDYFSFTLLTLVIVFILLSRTDQYKSYSFENLENVNIYNALKPSEVVKIYEENEISPAEQIILSSKEHQEYKNKQMIQNLAAKTTNSLSFGTINDVPKIDLKQKYKESLKSA